MNTLRQARKTARRLFRDCLVGTNLDEARALRAAMGVIEAQRRHGLRVLSQFQRLVRIDRDWHRAVVESALAVPADVRAHIETDLARRYGAGLQFSYSCDPELIGGLRITVGSDVYEGTVKGRLDALEDRF